MIRPDDIPEDVWTVAVPLVSDMVPEHLKTRNAEKIARAILADRNTLATNETATVGGRVYLAAEGTAVQAMLQFALATNALMDHLDEHYFSADSFGQDAQFQNLFEQQVAATTMAFLVLDALTPDDEEKGISSIETPTTAPFGPRVWIMRTADGWYPIQPSDLCKPEDHGRLNDHVLSIEDTDGNVLWRRAIQ